MQHLRAGRVAVIAFSGCLGRFCLTRHVSERAQEAVQGKTADPERSANGGGDRAHAELCGESTPQWVRSHPHRLRCRDYRAEERFGPPPRNRGRVKLIEKPSASIG